jgi:uncharacterized protein (DUF433 family)
MSAALYPHIEVNGDGIAVLSGTTTKVLEIVLDRLAYHWDPEEIQRQHPHLSLAQIYASLAYYYDHREEIDRQIDDRRRIVDQIEQSVRDSPAVKKLKQLGYIP